MRRLGVALTCGAGGKDIAIVSVAGAGRTDRFTLGGLADDLAARGVTALSLDEYLPGYSTRIHSRRTPHVAQ